MIFRVRPLSCRRLATADKPCLKPTDALFAKTKRLARAHSGDGPGREEGQASIEMIVSLMVVMSLMFWLFELSMFTYTCSVLNDAAQEGVRYATMHERSSVCSGPDAGCTNQRPYSNVQAVVTSAASASLHTCRR